jgi:hypothetical protein
MDWPWKTAEEIEAQQPQETEVPVPVVMGDYCKLLDQSLAAAAEETQKEPPTGGLPPTITPKLYCNPQEIPHSYARPPEWTPKVEVHKHAEPEPVVKHNGFTGVSAGTHRKDN